jgi:mono/diheme cytochrome c family protein
MRGRRAVLIAVLSLGGLAAGWAAAGDRPDPQAAERGRIALTTGSLLPPAWSLESVARARPLIGPDAPDPGADPDGYARAFMGRYGLHPAPYPNDGLPMGLRRARARDGARVGLHIDCLVCHGGAIGGTSYVGLGNTQLDLEALLKDLTRADGRIPPVSLFTINSTRGTNNAGMIDVALLTLRNPDLSWRGLPLWTGANLPELDTPAWWLLKKKRTKYYDGRTPADAVRSNMQFLLGDFSRAEFEAAEPTFRDVDAYLRSIEPPAYPFAIDAERAARGQAVFADHCARCHGTYGDDPTYPNKIVPLDVIGTDPARLRGLSDRFVAHYNASWFGEVHKVSEVAEGYQAPPLDGVWATAPYLHNGSVPTLYHLLKSDERPARFTRPPSTDFAHYDTRRVGWTFDEVASPPDPDLPPAERKRIVDTARFGLGNQGHTFGDALDEGERTDLIEYLKTL